MAPSIRPLQGGCACGRNAYVIRVPASPQAHDEVRVLLDNSSLTRRHTTSPFTPFLRVPLDWYQSMTYSFFPDETHRTIRRTFASPREGPQAQRHFCGYCGTQLSTWNEFTQSDSRFIHVNLCSLIDDDITRLEKWGLLQLDGEEEAPEGSPDDGGELQQLPITRQPVGGMGHRGVPWFEDMVEHSRFGKVRRQRGGYTSADGSESLQWEVVEIGNDGTETPVPEPGPSGNGKRKRMASGEGGDIQMQD